MINQDRLVKTFCDLVRIDSVSGRERELADFLKKLLQEQGFTVSEDNTGKIIGGNCGNVHAVLKGETDLSPLLFSLHMDTVQPGIGKRPQIGADRIIRSDGSTVLGADDMAGAAAVIEAVRSLREEKVQSRSLELLFSVAEEAHLQGIRHFDHSRLQAKEAYVLDTSGSPGLAVIAAPGHIKMDFTVTGRSAHAGIDPEKGISAISIAARAITGMRTGRLDAETTANIGCIEGGGETNLVADRCFFTAECRSLSEERLERQVAAMCRTAEQMAREAGGTVTIDKHRSYDPYSIAPERPVVRRFLTACANVGISGRLGKTGGGSDNNFLQSWGIEGVVLSCGMQQVHTCQEHIAITDLMDTARLVRALICSE